MTDPARPRLLVIPHVTVAGGAGLYNRAAIAALAQVARVTLIGDAASAYDAPGRRIADAPAPPRPILPAYSGASLPAFLFHVLLAPLRLLRLVAWMRRHASLLAAQDAVVATSSIDLLTLCAVGVVARRPRRICIVQENAHLAGLRGRLNRVLLKRMDERVSISPSWSAAAARHGIGSILAVNPFELPALPARVDRDGPVDLLFMGGGERIKGIDLFLPLVERLAHRRPVRAVLLGALPRARADEVAALQARLTSMGATLEAPGFVADTAPFLRASRLLLLPITAPHFCRPAVEAGLQGRTFVVSRLPGLEDFARDGDNCAMADAGDLAAWEAVLSRLLDDPEARHRLAAANRDWSMVSFSPATFNAAYEQVAAAC